MATRRMCDIYLTFMIRKRIGIKKEFKEFYYAKLFGFGVLGILKIYFI